MEWKPIIAILVQGHLRNFSAIFWHQSIGLRSDHFIFFFFLLFLALIAIFVQWSETVLIILVHGYERNISVKLFCNPANGLTGVVIPYFRNTSVISFYQSIGFRGDVVQLSFSIQLHSSGTI